jgi:putative transposase
MGVTELKRLRALEDENAQLKKLVADLSLDKQMLQDILKKKVLKVAIRKTMAHYLQEAYAVSLRRSLHIANVVPSIWY